MYHLRKTCYRRQSKNPWRVLGAVYHWRECDSFRFATRYMGNILHNSLCPHLSDGALSRLWNLGGLFYKRNGFGSTALAAYVLLETGAATILSALVRWTERSFKTWDCRWVIYSLLLKTCKLILSKILSDWFDNNDRPFTSKFELCEDLSELGSSSVEGWRQQPPDEISVWESLVESIFCLSNWDWEFPMDLDLLLVSTDNYEYIWRRK